MTKFQVYHWMGQKPPHPLAIQEDNIFSMQLTDEGIMTLARDYDVMIKIRKNDLLPYLVLDDKGRSFRQR